MPGKIQINDKKTIRAWSLYDFANSVFLLVITGVLFPVYYNQVTRQDGSDLVSIFGIDIQNTAIYSITLGVAFGIVALISPLLSSISDYTGNPKRFMKFFCYLGSAACVMLFFFTTEALIGLGLGMLLLATIGYSGSIVFYNAYLPEIASEDRQDQVSARGYAMGYLGATSLMILCLLVVLNFEMLGFADEMLPLRISFVATGLWWAGFAQIPFRHLPDKLFNKKPKGNYLLNGYKELLKIWDRLKDEKRLRTFLGSFFFYIMGVQTVMYMAASFGEKEIRMDATQLIIIVMMLEYVGIAGAFLFAWISKQKGNINALLIAISMWILITIGAYFIQNWIHFLICGFFIGMVMGGIQSLSRSTYAKMLPKTGNNAGYFSFYDVSEKVAMMLGLLLFGSLDNITGSMRNSIVALTIFFILGLIFMFMVRRMGRGNPEAVDQVSEKALSHETNP